MFIHSFIRSPTVLAITLVSVSFRGQGRQLPFPLQLHEIKPQLHCATDCFPLPLPQSLIHPEFLHLNCDSGYLELVKELNENMDPSGGGDGKSSPISVSDLSSTASAASMDSPASSSSATSLSLSTPPPPLLSQNFLRNNNSQRRSDDLCETLQNHLFIQSVIPEERPNSLDLRSSRSSISSGSVAIQHPEQVHLDKLSQNLKEIDDFITVTEEILKRDRQRDEEFYAREKQRKLRHQLSMPNSRPNSMRKSSALRRKFSMIERTKRESIEGGQHLQLRQTKSTEGSPAATTTPATVGNNKGNSTTVLQSRLNFQNGRVECVDPELRERNCIQKTHELVRHIIQQEGVTPLVQPEHVDRVLYSGLHFRRGSLAVTVTTEDFEMTNVCISEDQQEISEGTGPPIEEPSISFKELEPALSDREAITLDIEAPPPVVQADGNRSSEPNDVEM